MRTNNATQSNSVPAPAVVMPGSQTNYALQFDGVDDRVNLSPGSITSPASVTVEAWVRLDATGKLHFLVSSAQADFHDGFNLMVTASGQAAFTVALSPSINAAVVGTTALEVGTWYHVAGTYDADTDMLKVFLDGMEEASVHYAGGIKYAAGRDLRFGMQIKIFRQRGRFLKGALDEVRIWNYARTADQLAADRDHEIDGSVTGLLGYWRTNEGTGTATADATGADNVGQLERGPVWIESSWRGAPALLVTIDIEPGRDNNRVRLNKDRVRVAILSTTEFDAVEQVDWSSLTFGRTGDEESLRRRGSGRPHCNRKKVNEDRLRDLECKFESYLTGFEAHDAAGILKGATLDGVPLMGSDDVHIEVHGHNEEHEDSGEHEDGEERGHR